MRLKPSVISSESLISAVSRIAVSTPRKCYAPMCLLAGSELQAAKRKMATSRGSEAVLLALAHMQVTIRKFPVYSLQILMCATAVLLDASRALKDLQHAAIMVIVYQLVISYFIQEPTSVVPIVHRMEVLLGPTTTFESSAFKAKS